MTINFREAGLEDLETISGLVFNFYEITSSDNLSIKLKESVIELLHNPEYGKIWLMQDKEEPVGYIVITYGYSIEYNGRDVFVDEFFIKDQYRNKGIGKLTLTFVEEYLKNNGIRTIHLEVKEKHQKAKALYQREGFIEHKSIFMTKIL